MNSFPGTEKGNSPNIYEEEGNFVPSSSRKGTHKNIIKNV